MTICFIELILLFCELTSLFLLCVSSSELLHLHLFFLYGAVNYIDFIDFKLCEGITVYIDVEMKYTETQKYPKTCHIYSGREKFMPLPLKSKILETPGSLVTDDTKMFPL